MKNYKTLRVIGLVAFVLLIGAISVHAQPGDPPGGGGGGGPVGGAGVPLDGGLLSLLLSSGMVFSLFVNKLKKKEDTE